MGTAINEYVFYSRMGEELKRVFDEWDVREREEALFSGKLVSIQATMELDYFRREPTLGFSMVKGENFRS